MSAELSLTLIASGVDPDLANTISTKFAVLQCQLDKAEAERDALSAQLQAAREQEPVAVVTGVYAGRTVVMPLDGSVVLPERMALFSRPAPTIQASHDEMDSEVLEQFTRWLCIQMPQGTVIGSPSWWAPKIMRAISTIRAEQGGQRE